MHSTMNQLLRLAIATLATTIFFGCAVEDRAWMAGDTPLSVGTEALTVHASVAIPETAVSGLLPSPLLGPDRITIYVGDELSLALELINPEGHALIATQVPSSSIFIPDSSGGEFLWEPGITDVGQHDLEFLVVNADSPEVVTGQASIELSVLPRFGLIEYGF